MILNQTSGGHRSLQHVGRGKVESPPVRGRDHRDLKRGNKTGEKFFMKRIALAAILLALAFSASASRISARAAQSGGDLLQVLPDGHAVIVVDVQRVMTSSLWSAISANNKVKTEIDKAQAEISELGVNIAGIQTVAIAFSGEGTNNPAVALTGGFDQTDLLARLRTNPKVKLTSEKYKNFDLFSVESVKTSSNGQAKDAGPRKKDEGVFVFYDAKTVVVGSAASVRASVDTKLGSRQSIAQNAKLAEGIAQNPSAAVRFAVEVTPSMTSGLKSSELPLPDLESVKMVFGGIDVASGVDLVAILRSDTAEHAKNIADRLNGLLDMAKGFLGASNDPKTAPIVGALKTVTVTGADIDVKITGSLPMEIITQVLK
jgi:hypothetical protein